MDFPDEFPSVTQKDLADPSPPSGKLYAYFLMIDDDYDDDDDHDEEE